jgi:hypothetical protein
MAVKHTLTSLHRSVIISLHCLVVVFLLSILLFEFGKVYVNFFMPRGCPCFIVSLRLEESLTMIFGRLS